MLAILAECTCSYQLEDDVLTTGSESARPTDLRCHFLEETWASNLLRLLYLCSVRLNSRIIWTRWNLLPFFGEHHITTVGP